MKFRQKSPKLFTAPSLNLKPFNEIIKLIENSAVFGLGVYRTLNGNEYRQRKGADDAKRKSFIVNHDGLAWTVRRGAALLLVSVFRVESLTIIEQNTELIYESRSSEMMGFEFSYLSAQDEPKTVDTMRFCR